MRGVNRVILVCTLGNDPDVRYMPNGNAVANLSGATNETWKDQQGQQQEKTEWHRLTMFKRLAEIAGEYLKKGSQIYVEGKLQTRKWQDQQGQDRYTTSVIVDQMQMLGGGNNNSENNAPRQPQGSSNQNSNAMRPDGTPKTPQEMQGGNKPPMQEPDFDFDDDIPFAPIGKQHPKILYAV